MSKSKFIDKWNKFCQIPECHYLCDRISGTSDYGLGCPRLEKGYLVRIALFSFYFLGITFPVAKNIPYLYIQKKRLVSGLSPMIETLGDSS